MGFLHFFGVWIFGGVAIVFLKRWYALFTYRFLLFRVD